MHELSIASSVVEIASAHARRHGVGKVTQVRLRIGLLSCIHEHALRSGFSLVAEGTPLAGAELELVAVPVRIWCPTCGSEVELPGIQRLACPRCGEVSGDIRTGRELEIDSIVVDDDVPLPAEPP